MKPLLIKFYLLYLFVRVRSEYKSYKDYKIFNIQNGDGLEEFVNTMRKYNTPLGNTVHYRSHRSNESSVKHEYLVHHDVDEGRVFFTGDKNTLQMLIAPELVPIFEEIAASAGLKTTLVVDDFSIQIEEEKLARLRHVNFSWNAYYDVDDIHGWLTDTSQKYPEWTKLVVGGKSYEGRKLLGLQIKTPSQKLKPVIFIESGIHAREWIAPATTTYFINQLLTSSDPSIVAMREQFDWHIFPTVNPDGYHYTFTTDRMWRKTRSKSSNGCYGADPNRNWDYHWMQSGTSNNPCDPQVYGGSRAFSEVETKTLSEYIAGLKNLTAYIDFHSYGPFMLIPFSDSKEHIDNYDDLVKIGKTSLDYGDKVKVGPRYREPATAAEFLYACSGASMDWVRFALGTRLTFVYELRGEQFKWPEKKIALQGDEVTQMILGLLTEARNMGYFKDFPN
ncbi:zinc carboxypeptidase-like [Pectinophora gossypiella]|uniref:zinc carboxypeptidase-like n=1 Tax=Pectinophora gossypiella TaxID=13191 RepID=UPI00214F1D70|nr:zinc carboxypeptidase-like [Pectinophora gossypiella]